MLWKRNNLGSRKDHYPSKTLHRNQVQLTIGFGYDEAVKDYVKKFPNVRWSRTLRLFYVPFSHKTTNALFHYLKYGGYFVDYGALRASPKKDSSPATKNDPTSLIGK